MSATAGKPDNITNAEMALLPSFCPDTMGFNYGDSSYNTSPRAPYWVSLVGPGFWHAHHYCWGLIKLRRAERTTMSAVEKQGARESALADFQYVIANAGTKFLLAPEILTWIGRTELLLLRSTEAEKAFADARALKPDYWPAYLHWGEYLRTKGRKSEAMAIAKSGLQHAPDAKPLKELFFALGGKPENIPAPLPKPAQTEDAGGTATAPPTESAPPEPAPSAPSERP